MKRILAIGLTAITLLSLTSSQAFAQQAGKKGNSADTRSTGGQEFSGTWNMSTVYVKRGGKWLAVHHTVAQANK